MGSHLKWHFSVYKIRKMVNVSVIFTEYDTHDRKNSTRYHKKSYQECSAARTKAGGKAPWVLRLILSLKPTMFVWQLKSNRPRGLRKRCSKGLTGLRKSQKDSLKNTSSIKVSLNRILKSWDLRYLIRFFLRERSPI